MLRSYSYHCPLIFSYLEGSVFFSLASLFLYNMEDYTSTSRPVDYYPFSVTTSAFQVGFNITIPDSHKQIVVRRSSEPICTDLITEELVASTAAYPSPWIFASSVISAFQVVISAAAFMIVTDLFLKDTSL